MEFDAAKHHRRSVRFSGYDYRTGGAYFVTICVHRKRAIFGRMENTNVRLHPYGHIVREEWERVAQLRSNVELDEWIVMPDHFHAIVFLNANFYNDGTPLPSSTPLLIAASLGAVVGQFKAAVTRQINARRAESDLSPVHVWQRSFYDRVIRSEKELEDTRRYIIENPARRAHTCEPDPS